MSVTYKELKEKIVGSKIPELLLNDVLDNDSILIENETITLFNNRGRAFLAECMVDMVETVRVDRSPRNDSNPSVAYTTIMVGKNSVYVIRYSTSRSHKTKEYEITKYTIEQGD